MDKDKPINKNINKLKERIKKAFIENNVDYNNYNFYTVYKNPKDGDDNHYIWLIHKYDRLTTLEIYLKFTKTDNYETILKKVENLDLRQKDRQKETDKLNW